jgi:Ser-tRNA(Ala) deacylase AlaX
MNINLRSQPSDDSKKSKGIMEFVLTPAVDATQEFIEIANDFSNPLDLVREAVSNAYDARATEIWISFDVIKQAGESILRIILKDNGSGMCAQRLQNFFDLGNSSRRDDPAAIGEKGHGTKVYFNSRRVELLTCDGTSAHHAVMVEPFAKLHNREIPIVIVNERTIVDVNRGTTITLLGYNNSRRDKFTHQILKDYISWFTKHGAIENGSEDSRRPVQLMLKGLGAETWEKIRQGHFFPEDSVDINKLFDQFVTKAPDFYVKKIVKTGTLKNFPEIHFQAVFCIEGRNKKYEYNEMLRRTGYSAPAGSYTIQERYGLWLCKDSIPVQRKNEWITFKGSEYTKFHAFINCQGLRLTANRGSVDNTPSEVLDDIKEAVQKIYNEIVGSDVWLQMEWLEDEAESYHSTEREKKQFNYRVGKVNRSNVASYKGLNLVEPDRESGVFSMFLMLSQMESKLFPFFVVDYDTHDGIDVIAKGDDTTPIVNSKLFYVEFKKTLSKGFNHSFQNLHSVVCWDTDIKHDDSLVDVNKEGRKMKIVPPKDADDYTRYFLENPREAHRIEVYVMKQYLYEKLRIEFRPRTSASLI